jgi:hypothetical protein
MFERRTAEVEVRKDASKLVRAKTLPWRDGEGERARIPIPQASQSPHQVSTAELFVFAGATTL